MVAAATGAAAEGAQKVDVARGAAARGRWRGRAAGRRRIVRLRSPAANLWAGEEGQGERSVYF